MRIEAGSFKTGKDKNGTPYYLHGLTDAPRLDPAAGVSPPSTEPERADAVTLHEVYSAFLARLTLNKAHRENLRKRGLSEAVINRNGYKTLPIDGRTRIAAALYRRFGKKLLTAPGFAVRVGRTGLHYLTVCGSAGILIPVRDLAGRIIALKIRRDGKDGDYPRYSYMSSKKHGGPGPGSPSGNG
jgi:hypothetical protein